MSPKRHNSPPISEIQASLLEDEPNPASVGSWEYELDGDEALLRRNGNRSLLEPVGRWLALLATSDPLGDPQDSGDPSSHNQ